ncbi:FtsX-like permease family protein [Thiobaca trueperi]|uniref:Putative ABC transport system permease protein n=1 Tax=Thiobaca trueperi TaxID=127458 RepID=A0A4R3N225_9GAMM|nr:FtsX-like permease family protein [Thiobaca trueperi]TCT21996.1 putative ABC transport system permease protein [Thiobaca trueperi]
MNAALRHVFLASLWRRPLATSLSLLAIALGVALGLTVQLIHSAALDEFGRGIRLLSGTADLQIVGSQAGLDDALYPLLARHPDIATASPVLEIEARLPGRDETLRIFGIDLFRVAQVTPSLLPMTDVQDGTPTERIDRLGPLQPDALFLSPAAAARLALAAGDRLTVQIGVREQALRIGGSVPGAGVGQILAVMDIGAAQQVFDRIGRLTRIDLRLAPGIERGEAQRRLADLLPPGVAILTPDDAESEVTGLSRAYRVNLTMLAAIALLTGGFLVFSAQLLAVVRRRQEFALLRALGLDRASLRRGLLAEGAVLGLIGGLIGVTLAYLLTALAFRLIGGDLGAGFFRGIAPTLRFEPLLTLVYLTLGVLAGLGGAWLPAREAARMIPARGLRAGDEAEVYRAQPRWGAALLCLILAALLCLPPPLAGVSVGGYLAVLLVLIGAILILPGATLWAMRRLGAPRALTLRLARARLAAAPGQAVVAGAGVVASVALAVSMAIMVDSFRSSVDGWLTRMLPADLYLRASAATASGYLDPETVARIAALPGVIDVYPVRFASLRLDPMRESIALIARPVRTGNGLPLVAGSLQPTGSDDAHPAWISEALADRLRLGVGDPLALPLADRLQPFRVAGIWRDYARQQGAVVIELDDYRALTNDWLTNDLGLFLADGTAPETLMTAIRATLGEQTSEMILPGELRAMILAVFDRTFLVTYLMEAVAVLIGLFGIGTTFAALAASRRKEFGILRHLGLRRRQIGTLLSVEAALTAAVGMGVGLLAGGAIALVLIEVVNRQSFRWSMDLQLPVVALLVFGLSLILLAALAARLAGAQAMRQDAVLAVREDW